MGDGLREQHTARLRELGVADPHVGLTDGGAARPPEVIRVMQWNVLADGLSDDGFLVNDVLRTAAGEAPLDAEALAETLAGLRATNGDMSAVCAQNCLPRSVKNLSAVLDWRRRWLQIEEAIVSLRPDVITMQELDHMGEAQRSLRELGYSCGRGTYRPMHEELGEEGVSAPAHLSHLRQACIHSVHRAVFTVCMYSQVSARAYLSHLRRSGVAFATRRPSNARKLSVAAGRAGGDDDGSAIFWRGEVLSQEGDPTYLRLSDGGREKEIKRHSGVVSVALRRRSDGASLRVMCTHLSSGDKAEDEVERLTQLEGATRDATGEPAGPSVLSWFARAAGEGPCLLCLDANSSPDRQEGRTVRGPLLALPLALPRV